MPSKQVHSLAVSAALLLTAPLIPVTRSFGSTSCQTASDPNGLLASITVAEHRSKMSTDMLKLMLPCPGTPVSVGSLAQAVSAGFTPDQINLLLQAFTVTAVTPSDLVQLARTSLPTPEKERICNLNAPLVVTPMEFKKLDLVGLSGAQIDFMATHLRIRVTEKDFPLLVSPPINSNQPVLLQKALLPVSLKTEQSVLLLTAYPYRKVLSDKIAISDPALWACGLKKGASVSDISMFLDAGEHGAWEVAGTFQRNGIANSTTTALLVANRKHISLSASDVEHLSQSSLSDEQVTQIIRTLGHPALQLQPSSVARLKARGINDEVVLALTQEKVLALFPPSITADSYGDPFTKLASLSDRQNTHGLGSGSSNRFGSVSSDTNGVNGIFRVGGDVSAPVLVSKIEPKYSDEAHRACLTGAVLVTLVVDENGIPRNFHISRPLGMGLDEKAIEALAQWRFRPSMRAGKPVATQATVEITFRLLGCEVKPTTQVASSTSSASQSSSTSSTQSVDPTSPASKHYRDRGEYELFAKVTQTSDPLARLETLYSWENQYRQSDYAGERLQYFVAALAELAPKNPVLRTSLVQRCNELLKVDPSYFQASYSLAFWGPLEGGSHPAPELVAQIRTAAQTVISRADTFFDPAKMPPNGSKAELGNAKAQAITVAHKALAYTKQVENGGVASHAALESDLRVEIVQVQWNSSPWGATGFGKGNLFGSQNKQGFDFTFTCSRPFLPSNGGGYYPGKWKKPNAKLVILTTEIGNAKKHESCELKVSLEPFAYEVRNSPLATVPIR